MLVYNFYNFKPRAFLNQCMTSK